MSVHIHMSCIHLKYFFQFFIQLFLGGELHWDQYGLAEFLHKPSGTLLCQQKIQKLFPGKMTMF